MPQAKLANEAMHQKIMEMSAKAPNATMSITGHSLGTMISIQAVANLPQADLAKIDKVVLFQGLMREKALIKCLNKLRKIFNN